VYLTEIIEKNGMSEMEKDTNIDNDELIMNITNMRGSKHVDLTLNKSQNFRASLKQSDGGSDNYHRLRQTLDHSYNNKSSDRNMRN